MQKNGISIEEVYSLANKFFPNMYFRVEIWDLGLRFVWGNEVEEKSAFLQESLSKITCSQISGFLNAELSE